MPRAAALQDNHVTLGAFRVGESRFALDVTQTREIVRWQAPAALPRAPALIEGVIDLRGAVVPVVDLGRALDLAPVQAGPTARIVIVEVDGLVMGLAVDAAEDVLAVDVTALEDPPALATHAGYGAARAVVRRPGAAPVIVLSLEHVLECVYRSGIARGEDAA